MPVGFLMVAIGFLLLYVAVSKRGALVADFFVKLFQPTPKANANEGEDE